MINDEPGVAAATAERVERAIAELGFQRNDLARSLRQGVTSSTLGLVIEDVANPFYSAIAQAVETRGARARLHADHRRPARRIPTRERELVQALLRRRVDALLLVPASRDHAYLARETADGSPVVFLDRPPSGIDADCVLLDNLGGARTAVEHLLAPRAPADRRRRRPRQPLHRRTSASPATARRSRPPACRSARSSSGSARTTSAQAEALVRDLLALPADRRPTALFAGNNRNTVGALRAMRGAARAHVALVGFDDFELADLLGTTVVRHDSAQHGRATPPRWPSSASTAPTAPPRRVVVPTELIVRGSGEVPPS